MSKIIKQNNDDSDSEKNSKPKKDLTGKQIAIAIPLFLVILAAAFYFYLQKAVKEFEADDNRAWEDYSAGMIVIDLDGDGVEMLYTSLDASMTFPGLESIYFNHRANGFEIMTQWPDEKEGILVCDLDGDGKITTGEELFGPDSMIGGDNNGSGLSALKKLDSNRDGKLDAADPMFESLLVWIDAAEYGVTEDGELHTLAELGITSISLAFDENDGSKAEKSDGGSIGVSYLNLDCSVFYSRAIEKISVSDDILALPYLSGQGTLPDLHQVIAADPSGELRKAIEAFTAEEDMQKRLKIAENILFLWSGESHVTDFYEKYWGQKYLGVETDDDRARELLGFDGIVYGAYATLMQQTHLKSEFQLLSGSGWRTVAKQLKRIIADNSEEGERHLLDFVTNIGMFQITTDFESFTEEMSAGSFRMGYLAGMNDKYTSHGISEDGVLKAGDHPYSFWIQAGNEKIIGGTYDDVYIFSSASATHLVTDSSGNNTVLLWDGIAADDIVMQINKKGQGQELLLEVPAAGVRITIEGYLAENWTIMLNDGSTVTLPASE